MGFKKNVFILLAVVFSVVTILQLIRIDYPVEITGRVKNDFVSTVVSKGIMLDNDLKNSLKKEKYLILCDDSEESIEISSQASKTLDHLKKYYDLIKAAEFNNDPDDYNGLIITFEMLDTIHDIYKLIEYVDNGGRLFFAIRPVPSNSFDLVYRKLGIYEFGELLLAHGITLKSNILIKGEGLEIKDEDILTNSSMAVRLTESCKVHAVSAENTPLIWDVEYGKGKIMVFNGTMLLDKVNRGIFTGAISILIDNFVYPVINSKIFYIDDFPCPSPEQIDPGIYKDYRRNIANFYKEIWWPDIRKSAYEYDLKLTTLIIENYNDIVEPPFTDDDESSRKNLIVYGRELLKCGSELGIHGYNHQSLAEDNDYGYNRWANEENMVLSLNEVIRFCKDVFPQYKFATYVPPSNVLSPTGRKALLKGMPDLKSICSIYTDDNDTYKYIQEFEVAEDGIVEFPRITAGYEKDEGKDWSIYNGITSLGIFSHFIHPDDVTDVERNNNKNWATLYKELCTMLKEVDDNFGWLRSMTASEGVTAFENYYYQKPLVEYEADRVNIYCDNFTGGNNCYILRSDKKIIKNINCESKEIDTGVYLIHSQNPNFSIEFGGELQ